MKKGFFTLCLAILCNISGAINAQTQLMLYVKQPQVELPTVQLILANEKEKSQINAQDEAGNTALLLLLTNKNVNDNNKIALLQELIDNGADISIINKQKESPLIIAARNCNQKMIQLFLSNPNIATIINHQDQHGNSALLYLVAHSCFKGQEKRDLIKQLISLGADANLVNNQGENVFMLAVQSNDPNTNYPIIRNLANVSNTINHQDKLGRTALFRAVEKKDLGSVGALIEERANGTLARESDGMTPLMLAASENWIDGLGLLNGNDVINLQDRNKQTALIHAAKKSNFKAIQHLLSQHQLALDTYITDKDGKDAYQILLQNPEVFTTNPQGKLIAESKEPDWSNAPTSWPDAKDYVPPFFRTRKTCTRAEKICFDKEQKNQCLFYCPDIETHKGEQVPWSEIFGY